MYSIVHLPLFALIGDQNGESGFLPILGGILALILISLAFGYAFRLYHYTRGGQSAKSWGLLSWALFLLVLRLILELARLAAIFEFGPNIEALITFLSALLLALGFHRQKRILRQ